tara:strand:+ start:3358 stop:3861 length:504 start_codon:yes stop_codon:yes gene_type:complete
MDTKSFVKILRKVVREEVQRAVKESLTEQKVSHKKVINHGMQLNKLAEQAAEQYKPKVKSKKVFSKNSMLNDILNETAELSDFSNMYEGPAVTQEEWPTLNDETMTTNNVNSFASMMNSGNQVDATPTTDVDGRAVDKNAIPDHLTKALTRDYSKLVTSKAFNKRIK